MLSKPDPADVYVGTQIKIRRMSCAMTQQMLADAIRVTIQQLQHYEAARSRVSPAVAVRLARALDVHPGYFFDGFPDVDAGGLREAPKITSEVAKLLADYARLSAAQQSAVRQTVTGMLERR